jgi:hypothetical protein
MRAMVLWREGETASVSNLHLWCLPQGETPLC